jgi:hypothetical protein
MTAETVMITLLNGSSALAALVGERIYLDMRPENDALPAVVYVLVSGKPDNSYPDVTIPNRARIQVNCMDLSSEGAVAVREAVRSACHAMSGVIGGVSVVDCIQDGEGPDSYDELVATYVKPIDFIIHYLR